MSTPVDQDRRAGTVVGLTTIGLLIVIFAATISADKKGAPVTPKPTSTQTSWVMSVAERNAVEGVDSRVKLLDQHVAAVSSGDKAVAREIVAIAQELVAINRSFDDVAKEAKLLRGIPDSVAIANSGATWVVVGK